MRKSIFVFASALSTIFLAAGCSSAPSDEESTETGTDEAPLLGSCDEASIRAATPANRRAIIDRGLHWVDSHVMYSQSHYFEGYRQDCSGFVSMCWSLPTSRVTWQFAPFDGAVSHVIPESQLLPGDALNRNVSSHDEQHIMLFAGWMDAQHSRACVIQENQTGTPANIKVYGRSWFGGFTPIRFNNAPSSGGGGGGGGGNPPPANDCSVHADHKLWCTNKADALHADTNFGSAVVNHMKTTYSWFDCWGTGQLHPGGNTTWYHAIGDDNNNAGWMPAVDLNTTSDFDANPSAHGLAKCGGSAPPPPPPPPPPNDPNCDVHSDHKLWCTNGAGAPMYASPTDTSAVVDHLRTTTSWFLCWGTGQLHAGGNTTWYRTYGDDNDALGWVAAVHLNTSSAFDANPSAAGLPKCQ